MQKRYQNWQKHFLLNEIGIPIEEFDLVFSLLYIKISWYDIGCVKVKQ